MTDYTELIRSLRCENTGDDECGSSDCPYWSGLGCMDGQLMEDAAAAIEELQVAEPTEKQVVDYCHKRCLVVIEVDLFNEIKASYGKMPKRGKWITHPEVKNIYGGVYIECPFCGEKYVVQNVSDEKFCRNCGADMRAKMEVQE